MTLIQATVVVLVAVGLVGIEKIGHYREEATEFDDWMGARMEENVWSRDGRVSNNNYDKAGAFHQRGEHPSRNDMWLKVEVRL